jgi:tetratricopeptide (TPR) repeat protein
LVGAFVVGAQAEESVAVLGGNPAQACSVAASAATASAVPSRSGIAACDAALKALSLSRAETAAIYLDRGVLHFGAGDYAAALADNDAALRLDGALAEAFANRGATLAALHRTAEAIGDLDRALALAPSHPAVLHFNRGLAREDLGDVKGAWLDYREAARLAPDWARPKAELARFTVVGKPLV